ncbi:MAG: hypothetical protein KAS54_06190 [Dehalococcoidia bacterium]|nr:hypothetical protein [Dehalococcoidia bacterium]
MRKESGQSLFKEGDALLAAYTAYLYTRDEIELIGDPEEGAIFIAAVLQCKLHG